MKEETMTEKLSRNERRLKKGTVLSNKMTNTVVVGVSRKQPHPKYGKIVQTQTKYYAHTDKPLNIGDTVTIIETRPLSKLKRWRVVES